jgi:hypothetical protein
MPRVLALVALVHIVAVSACSSVAPVEDSAVVAAPVAALTRRHVTADIYEYQFDLRVGATPNAIVRLHRVVRELAPFEPRPSTHAVMLLHGDFANFVTNFVPTLGAPASSATGLAPFLAARGIDVWGVDRRWTLPGTDGDTSDFGAMGVTQELGDIGTALEFAHATRSVTDGDPGRIVLAGFSHGAELTYAYAASDGRYISAIAALDIYYDLSPDDADLRAYACSNATAEAAAVAQGTVDAPNSLFIEAGELDRSAPNDPSPIYGPPYTNREALLATVGSTYQFAPYTPLYHLAAPILDGDGNVIALRESTEDAVSAWFAAAPPHQSEREAADLDAIWCGKTARPGLANIKVPLFYLGAAGAFGAHGLYSTRRVSSTDVTTLIVHRFGPARVAEDFGHGDILYATDAPSLAWTPLLDWLLAH